MPSSYYLSDLHYSDCSVGFHTRRGTADDFNVVILVSEEMLIFGTLEFRISDIFQVSRA